jgi:hypothetical protein
MTAPLNRRGFLGAGALLAAGGLVLPRSARAAVVTTRPAAASLSEALASLRAVLDRPNVNWFSATDHDCQCARCRALRRQTWECLSCGYEGPWVVSGCTCRQEREHAIESARRHIAAITAGREIPGCGDFQLTDWQHELEKWLALPDAMCHASPHHEVRQREHDWCLHGLVSCPTCGNDGDGCAMDTPDDLLAMLRELRGTMRALERVAS